MGRNPKHTNNLGKILDELLPNGKSFCVLSGFKGTFLNNIKRTKTVHQNKILKLIVLVKKLEEKSKKDIINIQKLKHIVKERVGIDI